MPDAIAELLATDAARVKLGARGISTAETEQLPRNRHAIVRNPRSGGQEVSDCCSSATPTAVARSRW